MAELGFALSVRDVVELVDSFVSFNELEDAKLRLKFKGRQGHPSPDWMKRKKMERNNLSLKNATKLNVACYGATKNPFIIYHFYDISEITIKDLGIENRSNFFRNCDELGLPYEPKKYKVITGKGQKTLQVSYFIFLFKW